MRARIVMLVCILAIAFVTVFASFRKANVKNDDLHVMVCVGGVAKCLKYLDADQLVKQGLGVYGDCSAGSTGKIIKCHPTKGL